MRGAPAGAVSGGGIGAIRLGSVEDIERVVGARYRRARTDLGLGLTAECMLRQLWCWGYEVGEECCCAWLDRHRFGADTVGVGDSVFARSREQLMRWYHVEGLHGLALQDRYRQACGVDAEVSVLASWLRAPAQQLAKLVNNVDVDAHACGEYALAELQQGRSPSRVADELRGK